MLKACLRSAARPSYGIVWGTRGIATTPQPPTMRKWGKVQMKEIDPKTVALSTPTPSITQALTSKGSLIAQGTTGLMFSGGPMMEWESIMDLLSSDIGPFIIVGAYVSLRGCLKPDLIWLDRIIHIEAGAFILYGVFFLAFASTPFVYWIWLVWIFVGAAKTLVFVWMANPWFQIADKPMRVSIVLKRMIA